MKIYFYLESLYFHPRVFHLKNTFLFYQKTAFSEIFYSMIFGNQIWSSICLGNSKNCLHGLQSGFKTRESHKDYQEEP